MQILIAGTDKIINIKNIELWVMLCFGIDSSTMCRFRYRSFSWYCKPGEFPQSIWPRDIVCVVQSFAHDTLLVKVSPWLWHSYFRKNKALEFLGRFLFRRSDELTDSWEHGHCLGLAGVDCLKKTEEKHMEFVCLCYSWIFVVVSLAFCQTHLSLTLTCYFKTSSWFAQSLC